MRFLASRERNSILQLGEFKGKGKLHLARKIKEDLIKELAFLGTLEGWWELFMRRYAKKLKSRNGD